MQQDKKDPVDDYCPVSQRVFAFLQYRDRHPLPDRFQSTGTASREKPMKKLVFAILLIASPAWAQVKPVPKNVAARADPCAPIGQTADHKLVYSLKCDHLPAPALPPAPPPPEAEVAPPPEPEVHHSGLFGISSSPSGSSIIPSAPAGQ
jgi:hypothetical protein